MEETNNIQGDIDLLQFNMAHVREVKGKTKTLKCIVIPIEENDMYVKLDPATLKPTRVSVNVDIFKRKEVGQYGDTHYARLHVSKDFEQKYGKEVTDQLRAKYIGDFKPLVFSNDISQVAASDIDNPKEDDPDLPF